jgi:precorrin-8X/cobalt-precorrin-8 methylmutase
LLDHPITQQSFAIIDGEVGKHGLNPAEYAIARRVIHSTADFEFLNLVAFSADAINSAIAALQNRTPIIVDVNMVKSGIASMVAKTFQNPIIVAVEQAKTALPGKTRTETGILTCFERYPRGIYAIGNAPTALLALCNGVTRSPHTPALIIGAPVGFVSVLEAKEALARLSTPKILVQGRKGGSPVAAAIINALLVLAYEHRA